MKTLTSLQQVSKPELFAHQYNFINVGGDYDIGPYSSIIPAGSTNGSFNVKINDDNVLERPEIFHLIINRNSLPLFLIATNPDQTRVIIRNDDRKFV